jgi:hypothetical protein
MQLHQNQTGISKVMEDIIEEGYVDAYFRDID